MIDRSQGISGTEVAALFGMSPYLTRMGLYARKKGLVEETKQTDRMRIGKALEPVVVKLFSDDTHQAVDWADKLIAHPKEPLIIGTPDGYVCPGDGDHIHFERVTPAKGTTTGFEAKTAGLDRAFEWGDEGTDMVPQHYLMQCQYYMLLTGLNEWWLAALIGGNDFRKFHLKADEEMQALMLQEVRDFWAKHILTDTPPEIDGSEAAKQYLLKMYPSAKEGIREASPDEEELIVGISQTRKELKYLEDRKELLQNKLKQSIGFSKGITSPAGKATWSETPETVVASFTRKAGRTLRVYGKKGELNG